MPSSSASRSRAVRMVARASALPIRTIVREREDRPSILAERCFSNEPFCFGNHRAVLAGTQPLIEELLLRARADLTQAHRLDDAGFPVRDVLKRFASPEGQRLPVRIDSAVVLLAERVTAGIRDEPFEADGVDRVGVDAQTIIVRLGDDRVPTEARPDPRDRIAHLLCPGRGAMSHPPCLGQLRWRHRGGTAHDQGSEDRALARSERCRPGLE